MNYLQHKLVVNLEALRDYLEEKDENLQKRPRIFAETFAVENSSEPQEAEKLRGDDHNSTGSSEDKEAIIDTDVIDNIDL